MGKSENSFSSSYRATIGQTIEMSKSSTVILNPTGINLLLYSTQNMLFVSRIE